MSPRGRSNHGNELPVQIAAAIRGDKVALQLLQEVSLNRLLRFSYLLLKDFAVAQEMTGEVLAMALKNLDKVEVPEKFHWWLLRLLKTRYDENKDAFEGQASARKDSSLVWQREGSLPVAAAEASAELTKHAGRLNLPDRWMLLMWGLEEMDFAAISEVSGLGKSAVQRRIGAATSDMPEHTYGDLASPAWTRLRELEINASPALKAWVADAILKKSAKEEVVAPIRDKTQIDEKAPLPTGAPKKPGTPRKILLAAVLVLLLGVIAFLLKGPSNDATAEGEMPATSAVVTENPSDLAPPPPPPPEETLIADDAQLVDPPAPPLPPPAPPLVQKAPVKQAVVKAKAKKAVTKKATAKTKAKKIVKKVPAKKTPDQPTR